MDLKYEIRRLKQEIASLEAFEYPEVRYYPESAHVADVLKRENAAAIVHWENTYDDLVKALQLTEDAELIHANCDECDGEEAPECCEKCFPSADIARVARRTALAKAKL